MKRLTMLALALTLSGCASQFGMKSPHQSVTLPAKPVHVTTLKPATPQVSVVVTSIPPAKALRLLDRIKSRFHHKKGDVK